MTTIATNRLTLRELTSFDGRSILAFANNPSINRHLSFGSIASEQGVKDYIRQAVSACTVEPRLSYKLAMIIGDTNELSGSCWLDIEDSHNQHGSIGYFVGNEWWGQGYASEMVAALLRFGFEDCNLHRIYANCDAENAASLKVLEKVGMIKEGVLREHCLRSFGWADVHMFGILQKDWKKLRRKA